TEFSSIEPQLQTGLKSYIDFLEENLDALPKDSQKSKAFMSAVLLDIQRLNQFVTFLNSFGFQATDMLSHIFSIIESVQSLLSTALETGVSVDRNEYISTIISFYDYAPRDKDYSEQIRTGIENLHYWLDTLSTKGSNTADTLRLKLLSHQFHMELNAD